MARPRGVWSDKAFREALRRVVLQRDKDTGAKKLELLAHRLVNNALGGDTPALREVADRLDGKAHQTSDVNVETTRYVVEVPATVPTEEWERRFQPVKH